ncbi:uncharacterized protein DS421_11g347890 [Arachis hypogaea]|nr:uncharacterized protein DS421_11g347890 [Arachis hypogaea]
MWQQKKHLETFVRFNKVYFSSVALCIRKQISSVATTPRLFPLLVASSFSMSLFLVRLSLCLYNSVATAFLCFVSAVFFFSSPLGVLLTPSSLFLSFFSFVPTSECVLV